MGRKGVLEVGRPLTGGTPSVGETAGPGAGLWPRSCPGNATVTLMPWSKPLTRELTLKDGRVLRTLHDARYVFASGVFSGVKHSPPLERAIDLLMKAANSGDDHDVQAATDQVAIALRVHGMVT